ncbi:MAG: hypothetical protein ABW092_09525, partial [Candidatus Thiodiazotropha sp.]
IRDVSPWDKCLFETVGPATAVSTIHPYKDIGWWNGSFTRKLIKSGIDCWIVSSKPRSGFLNHGEASLKHAFVKYLVV